MSARASAIALFAAGTVGACVVGCTIAAYDLWGGVPPSLRLLMRPLAVLSLVLLASGGVQFVRSHPAEARKRAVLKAVAVLGGIAIVVAGLLITYYLARWDSSRAICEQGRRLPHRADRERELARGLGPLFPVIDPNGECLWMKHEMDDLRTEDRCPHFVLDDAPCRCDTQRWTGPSSPNRCSTGPTTCQYRTASQTSRLGCDEP